MILLAFILFSIALLGGFLALTGFESRRGKRFFAAQRDQYDQRLMHVQFVLEHVDFKAFVREEVVRLGTYLGHILAHFSLQIVRDIERVLTRLVRKLRIHHTADMTPGESTREFVKTLSSFKDQLKETRPEVPDVLHS